MAATVTGSTLNVDVEAASVSGSVMTLTVDSATFANMVATIRGESPAPVAPSTPRAPSLSITTILGAQRLVARYNGPDSADSITEYRFRWHNMTDIGPTTTRAWSSPNTLTITPPTAGKVYAVAVQARNAGGTSDWSPDATIFYAG